MIINYDCRALYKMIFYPHEAPCSKVSLQVYQWDRIYPDTITDVVSCNRKCYDDSTNGSNHCTAITTYKPMLWKTEEVGWNNTCIWSGFHYEQIIAYGCARQWVSIEDQNWTKRLEPVHTGSDKRDKRQYTYIFFIGSCRYCSKEHISILSRASPCRFRCEQARIRSFYLEKGTHKITT